MSYQGWTNYETWAVKLWLDNDEGLYRTAQDMVDDEHDDGSDLADNLKGFIQEIAPETAGLFGDLLTNAIENVNYDEIASSLIEDYEEDAA